MTISSTGDLVAVVAIVSAVLGLLLWIIRAQLAMSKEFRPNGGKSTRDSLDRIERDTLDLRKRLDRHIEDHGRMQR